MNMDRIPTTKIFIDADEDIVFVIDKVISELGTRALLIVPKHALLTSSLINLNLLSRKVAEAGKNIILISSSELVLKKGKSVGIVAYEKVENITEESWQLSGDILAQIKNQRQKVKDTLIKQRTPKYSELVEPESEPKQIPDMTENVNPSISESIVYPDIHSESPTISVEPKMISLGKFNILPGSDISTFEEPRGTSNTSLTKTLTDETKSFSGLNPNTKKKTIGFNFIGRDVGKLFSESKSHVGQMRRSQGNAFTTSTRSSGLGKLLRIIIFLIILSLILLFLGSKYAHVSVTIVPKAQTANVTERAVALGSLSEVKLDAKSIPLRSVVFSQSSSDTAPTTGESKIGTKATGVIDITNKTSQAITLQKGIIISPLSSSLKFQLTQTITIPARFSELTFSTYQNAPIEAMEVGEEYNIGSTDVQIEGYKSNTELSGRIYKKLTGGTSQIIKVVSQSDIDNLKKQIRARLEESLKQQELTKINSNDIIIKESAVFKEIAFETTQKVGTQANSFDISKLEYEYSVKIISREDLEKLADGLFAQSHANSITKEMLEATSATAEEIKYIGEQNKVEFIVKESASITPEFNQSLLKDTIRLKKIADAISDLEKIEEISSANINYSPFFIPTQWRKVPANDAKIEITIKSPL